MANTTTSPNMLLIIPTVGVDPGPQFATDINNSLTIIDGHNHSPGSGVQITPAGMDISSDLPFNNNNLTIARSVRFNPQSTTLSNPTDLGCLYEVVNDLYYNDGLGNQIRITQSGGVAGTPGSISNLTPPASASYSAVNQTFVFQSAALTPANIDVASVILRNLVANSFGLTLSPPNAMGADYTITLPSLPGSNLPVSINASGVMSAAPLAFAQLDATTQARIYTVPTVQVFLTGSGTYTTPTSPTAPLYIKVRMVGGGAGGADNNGNSSGSGGTTTFGTSLLTCTGATGASPGTSSSGPGGTATVSAPAIQLTALSGGLGGSGATGTAAPGGQGASSPFGGEGNGGTNNGTGGLGGAAVANTGSGGGGQGNPSGAGGGGGSAGGYLEAIIGLPTGTYSYAVGAGGTAVNGGTGGSGIIIVEEYY